MTAGDYFRGRRLAPATSPQIFGPSVISPVGWDRPRVVRNHFLRRPAQGRGTGGVRPRTSAAPFTLVSGEAVRPILVYLRFTLSYRDVEKRGLDISYSARWSGSHRTHRWRKADSNSWSHPERNGNGKVPALTGIILGEHLSLRFHPACPS
jgi:hypothetical protein